MIRKIFVIGLLILLCTGCPTDNKGDDGGGDTPSDAVISPTTANFDKNVTFQADIAVSMTLNGNTLDAISDGSKDLAAGGEYSMSGSTVTIHKSYLAGQAVGSLQLTFDISAGQDPVLTVTVSDTTPAEENYTLNITVSGSGTTDPAAGAHDYAAGTRVSVAATPAAATFTGWSGAATGTENPVTVTMDTDKTLTANFADDDDGSDDGDDQTENCRTPPDGLCSTPQVRIRAVELGVPVVTNDSETGLKPLAVAAIPSGGSWLAWMSDDDRVYIARLDCEDQLTDGPFSFPANDFQDIAADHDGGVILLTRNAQGGGTLNCGNPANLCDGGPNPAIPCYGMYMVRFNNAGREQWATHLTTQNAELPPYSTGPDGPNVHMIWWYQHHGRLAWDGSNFAAYFCEALSVSQNGCINIHEGDRMQVVDPNGLLLSGHDSVEWGCSHSWNTRMIWNDATDHFSMVCATDRVGGIAQPNDPGHLLYTARDLSTLSVGDIVAAGDGGYWITASDQGAVLLMHFSNGTVDRTSILGSSPHSKLAAYGSGLMVAGWGSGSTITAQVFDTAAGNTVGAEFALSVPDNVFQPFKAYPDGSVAYAASGTGTTGIRIARILPCTR